MERNPGNQTADHISVCVCTFKRPALLESLLDALGRQVTHGEFTFDIVIVDNDVNRSSEALVREAADQMPVAVTYDCEPERNISLTRNRAVRRASGSYVAFIDDDESPVDGWLLHLHRTLRQYGADGVLAPVLPDFPPNAPGWLQKAKVFHRRRHETGTRITAADARTGNVLLDRALFIDGECWFDPAFGRTGGEDSDFFARHFSKGRVFVWCDEAVVRETVPPERWTARFHMKRLWRAGTTDGEWMRQGRMPGGAAVAKNVLILGACAVAVPPSMVFPKHVRMRVAQKLAYCGGVVTAYLGFSMLRNRD